MFGLIFTIVCIAIAGAVVTGSIVAVIVLRLSINRNNRNLQRLDAQYRADMAAVIRETFGR